MSKIFNKVRSFPEYHNASDSLNDYRKADSSVFEAQAKAFGDDFTTFNKTQPEELQNGLNNIRQSGSNQSQISQELFNTISVLPSDFHVFLDYFNEKKEKTAQRDAAEAAALKAEAAAIKAEEKLNQAKAKGGDTTKLEAQATSLRQKATTDRENAENVKNQYNQYTIEYSNKFNETFITMMSAFFSSRQKSVRQLATVGQEISNAVLSLHDYHDKNIPILQKRLQQFEEMEV